MDVRRRRMGVLAVQGVMALGIAALVIAVVGVFSGTPTAQSSTHHHHVALPPSTTTTSTTAPAPAGPPASTWSPP